MAIGFYVAGAVVVAAGLIVAEALAARRRRVRIHDPRWTLSNLSCGALRVVSTLATKGLLLGVYSAAYSGFHLFEMGMGPATMVFGFVAFEFAYYLSHRASHRSPLLWALHETHHQSRDFNLTVSFRIGALSMFSQLLFDLPLALIGVPPLALVAVKVAHTAFMFLMHSRFIGRLGPLGYVFNTPAFHRVHHSAAERHYDSNFGGIFIIFDRLFGTFKAEEEIDEYGVTDAEEKIHPVLANVAPLAAWLKGHAWAPR